MGIQIKGSTTKKIGELTIITVKKDLGVSFADIATELASYGVDSLPVLAIMENTNGVGAGTRFYVKGDSVTGWVYIGDSTATTSTAAELNKLASVVAGTASASKALVLGTNKNVDTLVIADSGLKLGAAGGTAVTSTAADLNIQAGQSQTGVHPINIYTGSATTAELNAGTKVVVPAVTGKAFTPVFVRIVARGGNASGATGLDLVQSVTTANKVLAVPVAALTQNTWCNENASSATSAYLAQTLTGSEGIIFKANGTLATATSADYIIGGYYA